MKIKVVRKEHIFEPGKYFMQCHASTLIRFKNRDILSAWFGGTHEGHKDVAIWCSMRKEGKWGEPVKVADEEGVPCWNPVLFKDEKDKVYLFYKVGPNPRTWYTKLIVSEDMGNSWSSPKELVDGDIGGRGPVKNKIIMLSNGTWLAPASIETDTSWDAFVDISKDHGRTWIKSSMVPLNHDNLQGKGVIQPTLWESKPGKVHMLLRSTEGFIYRSDSNDYGSTWCEAYPTNLPNNNSGIDLVKMKDDRLVLVYNPVSGNWAVRTPIACSISSDNGSTWSENFILDHNENPIDRTDGEFSYPAVIAEGNHIYITYTWKRQTIAYWELEV